MKRSKYLFIFSEHEGKVKTEAKTLFLKVNLFLLFR